MTSYVERNSFLSLRDRSLHYMSVATIPKMVSISDLQRKARQIFEELDDVQPTLVLSRNRTVGVVLKPNIYEEIMEGTHFTSMTSSIADAVTDKK